MCSTIRCCICTLLQLDEVHYNLARAMEKYSISSQLGLWPSLCLCLILLFMQQLNTLEPQIVLSFIRRVIGRRRRRRIDEQVDRQS